MTEAGRVAFLRTDPTTSADAIISPSWESFAVVLRQVLSRYPQADLLSLQPRWYLYAP